MLRVPSKFSLKTPVTCHLLETTASKTMSKIGNIVKREPQGKKVTRMAKKVGRDIDRGILTCLSYLFREKSYK